MADRTEIMRSKSQSRLDQLIAMLDDGDPRAIRESRKILMRIVVEGNPVLLADVMRGMAGRLDGMQDAIDQRRKGKEARK